LLILVYLCPLLTYFGLMLSLSLSGESTLGIGWECPTLDLPPFKKVLV